MKFGEVIAAAVVVGCSAAAAAPALAQGGDAPAGNAKAGQQVFKAIGCWECHGTMGQGSIMTSAGKRLAPDPLPWETFLAFVRSSNRAMPSFSEKILSDDDLADIYAYLQSVPEPPASIPLLNP